ncbi:hypothetical protein UFOVP257_203 [uncultured Caudovirales phage]|uniref:Uncharacterized protein n=1 Tax=uncultured Caudovirales phage TaxID=2100421 RepID=A0A6J5LP21_9CAUD|nr:hypothetical protein UFOVP257_203 [uncultured Caudovirales phage]
MNISNSTEWYYNQRLNGYEDPYVVTHLYTDEIESDSVFVEIGSDRFVGSTEYYAKLAEQYGTVLHSVDIVTKAQERIKHQNIIWHTAIGSEWAKNVYPTIGKKISVLFLDNYDYIWDADTKEKQNSNTSCQLEHFTQLYHLYPWLTEDCTIVLDDTFMYNGCWVGKSGASVIFLLSQGFEIVWEADFATSMSCGYTTSGVVMKPKKLKLKEKS